MILWFLHLSRITYTVLIREKSVYKTYVCKILIAYLHKRLSPGRLTQLCDLSCDYNFYGISAIEKALSESVLRGRPLWRGGYFIEIIYELHRELFTLIALIVVGSLTLISLYLPAGKCNNGISIISDTLSEIELVISKVASNKILIGVDLNIDLRLKHEAAIIISKFPRDQGIARSDEYYLTQDDGLKYTYCQESMQHYSYTDYVLISDSILPSVVKFDVLDCAINMSDHCPIMLNVQFNSAVWRDMSKSNIKIIDSDMLNNSRCTSKYKLRWDHSDCRLFYNYTMALFEQLLNQCSQLLSDILQVDSMYNYDDYCRFGGDYKHA